MRRRVPTSLFRTNAHFRPFLPPSRSKILRQFVQHYKNCKTALTSQFWSVMVSVMKLIIGLVMRLFRQPVMELIRSWGRSCDYYLAGHVICHWERPLGQSWGQFLHVMMCLYFILPGSRKRLKESFTPILTFW